MNVCHEAIDLHGSLITAEQNQLQDELKGKFRQMKQQLSPMLAHSQKVPYTMIYSHR